jgi:hypothetical protein
VEPINSSPQTHVATNCLDSQPDLSSQCPHSISWRSSLILRSHRWLDLPRSLCPSAFPPKSLYVTLLSRTRYMLRLYHSSRFDHPKNIWWEVQIIKLIIMLLSPLPYHVQFLRHNYFPQQLILKKLQPTFPYSVSDQYSQP